MKQFLGESDYGLAIGFLYLNMALLLHMFSILKIKFTFISF